MRRDRRSPSGLGIPLALCLLLGASPAAGAPRADVRTVELDPLAQDELVAAVAAVQAAAKVDDDGELRAAAVVAKARRWEAVDAGGDALLAAALRSLTSGAGGAATRLRASLVIQRRFARDRALAARGVAALADSDVPRPDDFRRVPATRRHLVLCSRPSRRKLSGLGTTPARAVRWPPGSRRAARARSNRAPGVVGRTIPGILPPRAALTEPRSEDRLRCEARPALPFTGPWLLAPMEGVTEPCFRELVLARNPARLLGGAFTEFARVSRVPLPKRVLRAHLGGRTLATPVGLQLMGPDAGPLAETAYRAAEVGAPLVDLNFGCPARGAVSGCAGSALLREPRRVEELVRACAEAVPELPVSAKIRAGYDDDALLEELARAAQAGGAAMLTVHCRTRAEHYRREVDWTRIARAVASVAIPVCGNGGVRSHADLERMRRETGCRFVMVGHGALADPWIFGGEEVATAHAAAFLLEYASALAERQGMRPRGVAGRLKQLLAHWTAGGLVPHDRAEWLREREPERLLARLGELAREAAPIGRA